MRKVYILSGDENQRDGDMLLDRGLDPDALENPTCPHCGSETLLAYEAGGEYSVVTWFCLTEEDEQASPEAWYLICQDSYCPYEEQVERVIDPGAAVLFDLEQSSIILDEQTALIGRSPAGLKALIAYLEKLRETHPHRKLTAFLEEAQWRYDDQMKRIRRRMNQVPPGRKILIRMNGKSFKAKLLVASGERILVQTIPQGEMVGISMEEITAFSPQRDDKEEEAESWLRDPDSLIMLRPPREYVVVGPHHLRVWEVDRFGLFRVSSSDPAAAKALGLRQASEDYWVGIIRRREIDARYEKKELVRVRGFWVEVYGQSSGSKSPALVTEDSAAAAELGLQIRQFRLFDDDEFPPPLTEIPRWYGVIAREQVEEWDEVTINQWPIPGLKGSG